MTDIRGVKTVRNAAAIDKHPQPASKLFTKHDLHATRVRRFIRNASLDKVPQFFNVVFMGNLPLLGPPTYAVNAKAEERRYDEAVDGCFACHQVKPGLRGWVQVSGWRGEPDTHEKIQRRHHDIYYINNRSVLLDLYILALASFALLNAEKTY